MTDPRWNRPPHRDPNSLMIRDVCPHCHCETHNYRFSTPDGNWLETHHCPEHGDVIAIRSHIVNQPLITSLPPA